MENYKYIDITQLPDDLWQDAKNLIALDSDGEVIKAAKQDSYSKDEIETKVKNSEEFRRLKEFYICLKEAGEISTELGDYEMIF